MTRPACSIGRTRFLEQPREGQCRLRHVFRVLEQQDVAHHQLRPGYSRNLVVRQIPRLDAEQHADRLDVHCSAGRFCERTGLQIGVCVLRVVIEDAGRRFHFP
jgi:hypothetical protein